MLTSIITICYNAAESIGDAVSSVLSQEGVDLEYLVVDGASSDDTLQAVEQARDAACSSATAARMRVLSEPDRGLYDALNKGIRLAAGDVIGFLHADDLYADGQVLADVIGKMQENGVDGVYGDLQYVARDDPTRVIRHWRSGAFEQSLLHKGWMPPHPAFFVKREVYEAACLPNGEFFDTTLRISADYDFMMRILGRDRIPVGYLPRVLVKMRLGGQSNKGWKNLLQKSREDLCAMRRNQVGGLGTLMLKNLRKLPQFVRKAESGERRAES